MPLHNAESIGQLADETRRALYEYVAAADEPVSREEAAIALEIAPHQAKFHLDRLEQAGLLTSSYARPEGRTGPGAGRPAKHYRRPATEFSLTIPPRNYDLAGHILAGAIVHAQAQGVPVATAVRTVAREQGRALADPDAAAPTSAQEALGRASEILRTRGYEPHAADEQVVLRNCPFHALADEHRDLVCSMNHELICGLDETLAPHSPVATLDPQPGRCCVTLRAGDH